MRSPSRIAIDLALIMAAMATPALAQDGYEHGRLRYVDPGVTIQRATDAGAEEALANEPFLPGDRVWTDADGRADFQFPDGSDVRLDTRSKLDYAGHEEEGSERITLRLWSGSVVLHTRPSGTVSLGIDTPGGLVNPLARSIVRVDVSAGEARVSVYEGEAVLDDGRSRTRLAAGERTFSRLGGQAEEPERFDIREADDFLRWDASQEEQVQSAADEARYLPSDLAMYGEELDRYGDWRDDAGAGYVWVPRVDAGWRPYWNGRWIWTPYGWTWVPTESWGWAPFHYGRWDYAASLGWYWVPGRTWGPAWVSWAVGDGYVGWSPLGRHDRPVVAWGHGVGQFDGVDRGHAVLRSGGPFQVWSVVRTGELGRGDLARRRVPMDRIDPTRLHVGDTALMRPTRDVQGLKQGDAVPRAVRTRQTPGDFVRELGVDNMTTIPAPWTRGYGPPPAGVEGARYGVPKDEGRRESTGGGAAIGRTGTRTTAAPAPANTSAPAGSSAPPAGNTATPRSERSAPWLKPADQGQHGSGSGGSTGATTGGGSVRGTQPMSAQPAGGASDGARSRGGQIRPTEPHSSGERRPSGGEVHSSGSSGHPSGASGGSPHSGSSPRSGGTGSSGGKSSSGDHAVKRPHKD